MTCVFVVRVGKIVRLARLSCAVESFFGRSGTRKRWLIAVFEVVG